MDARLLALPLDRLDWQDRSFAIRSFTPTAPLQASLQRHGLLFPPWVWHSATDRWVIVDGFKRLEWLQAHSREALEFLVFPAETEHTPLLLRRLEAKVFGNPLNLAEKAQIVAQLAAVLPHQQVLRDYFPLLNLAARPAALEKWCAVARSEDFLLAAIATEQVCERAALELVEWDRAAREQAIALLCELRCSSSIQLEIIERIGEIALSQGQAPVDMFCAPDFQGIWQNPGQSHRQKTQALRDLLHRWRFPRLWARQQRFAEDLARTRLPAGIRLQPPAAFEGSTWQVQIQFTSPEMLQGSAAALAELAGSPQLQAIISSRGPDSGQW
jgi:ParB family transcriptional regulator, chromosome partitioning protein